MTDRLTRWPLLAGVAVLAAVAAAAVAWLLVTVVDRKQEERNPYVLLVELDEDSADPAIWGTNFPRQYESYLRTVDHGKTRYGGSDAVPEQMLDSYPWLRTMWSGYAFSLDYRHARGHAWMLHDQDHTERVLQRSQPGACLHCHATTGPAYRYLGDGDELAGFVALSGMPWNEARNLKDDQGQPLVEHPLSCVGCHDPDTMALRVSRPGFKVGIAALRAHEGVPDYDVNRDATRQEMRTFVCAQCHVEYYFSPEDNRVIYPWAKGIRVEEIEAYYDEIGFSDWTHGTTGAPALKAQHPEFEMWSQGVHARAGVACADCHMPYQRQGAMKVSDHHIRSPLRNLSTACQTCHNIPEAELIARVHAIQDRTRDLEDRAANALMGLVNAVQMAREEGATEAQIAPALALQRRAQWRLDFAFSENSTGFHAPQEAARILAEAIDYARQGEGVALSIHGPAVRPAEVAPVEGVTPSAPAP